jgi:hypothetical protein
VAWGAVCGPGPDVEPVDAVVGDAAAGFAVVFVVGADEVELSAVVVGARKSVVVVDDSVVAVPSALLSPPLLHPAASVKAASAAAIVLVPIAHRA